MDIFEYDKNQLKLIEWKKKKIKTGKWKILKIEEWKSNDILISVKIKQLKKTCKGKKKRKKIKTKN